FSQLSNNEEGRAQLFSHRIEQLRGTDIERTLVESMAAEGLTAVASSNPLQAQRLEVQAQAGAIDATTEDLMERMAPLRSGFRTPRLADTLRHQALSSSYIEFPRLDSIYEARYQRYWANAFRGVPLPEAQIRWQQAWLRAVMLHELGHGLGLEHNFAGSLDRN